jgi:ubiquinone/menaquinone biosynthesis C-methylase UbiE
MRRSPCRAFVTTFVLTILASTTLPQAQNVQENVRDAERLVKVLELDTGSRVGEIGAGDGALSIEIARTVGDTGRVFSNEVNTDRLAAIRAAVRNADAANVTVVEGSATGTNLPDGCCDAIFMRDVYHHFTDPAAMNASLFRSLKPGGRLALQEFGPPPGGESDVPAGRAKDGHHGITAPTLRRELEAAGFEIVSSTEFGFRNFLMVARRPQ